MGAGASNAEGAPAGAVTQSSRGTYARLATRTQFEAGVGGLLSATRRLLRCADRDLARFGLATRASTELLERLLLGDRSARVRLLIDDPLWVGSDAPRLRALQLKFSHALEIRIAAGEEPVGDRAWLLGDARHALTLRPAQTSDGELWMDQPAVAAPLANEFDRLWDATSDSLPAVPLGL